MPTGFALDDIPPEMVLKVVNKVPANELIYLHRSNKRLNDICECRKAWVCIDVPMIVVSRNGIEIKVDNNRSVRYSNIQKPIGLPFSLKCSHLNVLTQLEKHVIRSIQELTTTLKCQYDTVSMIVSYFRASNEIDDLLQITRPYKAYVKGYLQKNISPSIFDQLASISMIGCDLPASALCKLKAGCLTIRNTLLTSEDCNLLIQNWYERPRRIRIHATRPLNVTVVTAGLPVSLVYNTECHDYSVLKSLDQEKFDDSLKRYSFYMLIKPDAIYEKAMLIIGPNSLEIAMPCDQPQTILFPLLIRLSHEDYACFASEYCTSCKNMKRCHCGCLSRGH